MKTGVRALGLLFTVAVSFGLAKPASANFLYDLTGLNGHQQFIEPSILTSTTEVTSFIVNTSSFATSLFLGPDSGDNCNTPITNTAGPCLALYGPLGGGNAATYVSMPTFEAVGSFTSRGVTLTITEVAAVPEPATLALLGLGLFGIAVARRRSH